MEVKYFGAEYEKGLNLTVTLIDGNGGLVTEDIPMVETFNGSAIYKTDNILDITGSLGRGLYIARVVEDSGEFLGHTEIIWNGIEETTVMDINTWSKQEQMEIRDALGISGDKSVATGGQLQKKSEHPYNDTIDTNDI